MNIAVNDSKLEGMSKFSIASRLIYLILHGYKVMGRIDLHYDEIELYSNLTRKTIAKSITELIDGKYIARINKSVYKIL